MLFETFGGKKEIEQNMLTLRRDSTSLTETFCQLLHGKMELTWTGELTFAFSCSFMDCIFRLSFFYIHGGLSDRFTDGMRLLCLRSWTYTRKRVID